MSSLRKVTLETFGTGILQPIYVWFKQLDDALRTYQVQGKHATSNEYYVAIALDAIKLGYTFQLSIQGGRTIAYGSVLDFLVDTVPLPTPLWVNGEYWHMGAQAEEDNRQQSLIDAYMQGEIAWPPIVIWGDQSKTPELAMETVRRYFL